MRSDLIAILALAALVLAPIVAISPNTTTLARQASYDISGISISGLTRSATSLPEEQFPAH